MEPSSPLGLILVTTGSEVEAQAIAEDLITAQLAACVSLYPIQSIYRWQGAIHRDAEYQLVIKTDLSLFEKVAAQVSQNHSYDLPEVIALPMAQSTEAYSAWIREQLQQP